jgi:formylglycine-generating enzyme required for sulfatase activity
MRLNACCPTLVAIITLLGSLGGHAQLLPEATAKPEQNTAPKSAQKPSPKPGEVSENPKDGLKYVWIPPGTFTMGFSPGDDECRDEEKPAHRVTISKGFWIGQTEVTVGAYQRFVAAVGKKMPDAPSFNAHWMNKNMPIVRASWVEAQAYCQWSGGRLPTEAEWEYAARGGSTEARYGPLDEIAWYYKNSGNRPHDVAQKRANGFGLYNTLGNVWEWVNDWYDKSCYQKSPSQDPSGPSSGQHRVMRGGLSFGDASSARVSDRTDETPTVGLYYHGLRCVREANAH